MNSVTLENFRCFGKKRTVRLAPLTLLIGENSTGKTSFLAAVRALAEMTNRRGLRHPIPTFREAPFDMGTFKELVYQPKVGSPLPASFLVGSEWTYRNAVQGMSLEFVDQESAPWPKSAFLKSGSTWAEIQTPPDGPATANVGTSRGSWSIEIETPRRSSEFTFGEFTLWHLVSDLSYMMMQRRRDSKDKSQDAILEPRGDAPNAIQRDRMQVLKLLRGQSTRWFRRIYAGAAIRVEPRRNYEFERIATDPQGSNVPMDLARLSMRRPGKWGEFRADISEFGVDSGLFDDIEITRVGTDEDLFRIGVRKRHGTSVGPWRKLTNVGYGVSQSLPVIAELLIPARHDVLLLQQPEVHLHPKAQAALGSLFCKFVSAEKSRRQVIAETHSDFIVDRVRMDVRDGKTDLKPEDVCILYFAHERSKIAVHEIGFDVDGNLTGVPEGYRGFFEREVDRALWPDLS